MQCVRAPIAGIGKVTEQTLNALGISTCGQMLQQRGLLSALFKPATVEHFQVRPREVVRSSERHPSAAQGPLLQQPNFRQFPLQMVSSACVLRLAAQMVMLGLGETRHAQRPAAHEPGRKGISVERTFQAISGRQELEDTVRC